MVTCSIIGQFTGIHHLMPYIVQVSYSSDVNVETILKSESLQVLNTYRSPISPNWATVRLKWNKFVNKINQKIKNEYVHRLFSD